MKTEKKDIFAGSYVRVSLNRDTISETPSYFDPGYIGTDNLAAFPSVSLSQNVQTLEEYRDDFSTKLAGDIEIKPTQLSVFEVPNDPFIEELDSALNERRKLRFRNLYVIDSENGQNSQNGLYNIFDAYVSKKQTTGTSDSVVTSSYTLEPEGQLFQGFAEVGEVLREGDFGIGAGTDRIPGVKDLGALTGNRWITVDASNSQNPFGADTSAMAIQHPNNVGWELIGTSTGAPKLRIRNKQQVNDQIKTSAWVKVYTENDKPTSTDVGALPIIGGTITGNLIVNGKTTLKNPLVGTTGEFTALNTGTITATGQIKGDTVQATSSIKSPVGNIDSVKSQTTTTEKLTSTEAAIGTVKSSSVQVNNKEVYHPGNKPTPADIGALAINANLVVDFGTF